MSVGKLNQEICTLLVVPYPRKCMFLMAYRNVVGHLFELDELMMMM